MNEKSDAPGIPHETAPDEYDRLRHKWKEMLTCGDDIDLSDSRFAGIIAKIDSTAKKHWDTMNKDRGRRYLWPDLAGTTVSAHITAAYRRLRDMALACETKGCALYNNKRLKKDIVSALDWMYLNRYNESIRQYNNWWDWVIGAPLALNDITVLLYDDLSNQQITNYMNAVDHFEPRVQRGGANRIWDCTVIGLRGVIVKDSAKIAEARDGMSDVFRFVTEGEGFYSDGSFIQHNIHPYTGGYGYCLLCDTANMMYLLKGSTWQVTDPESRNVFKWVYDSFEPLMYRGAMMDMSRGRNISRYNWQDHVTGHAVIEAVIRLSQVAPEEDAANFRSMVKEWIQSDTYLCFYEGTSLNLAALARKIEEDAAIRRRGELLRNKQYNEMARTVHLRPGFAFGISMYSSRIANYESINGENLRGWYTGSGATYLYNGDTGHYSDNFWPTVDSHRIPGTTVPKGTVTPEGRLSCHDWVGGTSLRGLYGITGMAYRQENMTLEAKKSWFMFDDEIVALGADISSEDGIEIETVIENRKLRNEGDNKLTVDGCEKPAVTGWSERMPDVRWMHLEGNLPGAGIGYYFPDRQVVCGLREQRTDAWSSINLSEFTDKTLYTRRYMTLWIDHGKNPKKASYSYVLLPNKTAAGVEEYAARPHITILENSGAAQAVRENTLGITGVNFWQDGGYSAGSISCDKRASVIIQEESSRLYFSLADPTFSDRGRINIEIGISAGSVISKDEAITIEQLKPVIRLSVNAANLRGRIVEAVFMK